MTRHADRTEPQEWWTLKRAECVLERMRALPALTDVQVRTLERIANVFATRGSNPQAVEIRSTAEAFLAVEEDRRQRTMRERYGELSTRREAGAQLTAAERRELKNIVELLSAEH